MYQTRQDILVKIEVHAYLSDQLDGQIQYTEWLSHRGIASVTHVGCTSERVTITHGFN
jgi:hypothetical protein